MLLHLVRHGESTWNVEGRLQGQTPHPELTARGRAQADAAGRELEASGIVRIWTSDLTRAAQTATIIASRVPVEVRPTELLREQGLGSLEGRLTRELHPEPTPEGRHVSEVRWGGGESLEDVHRRLAQFVAMLDADGDDVALVSHGDTLRVLLALLDGRSHREVRWAPIANGAVLHVER
ncbi:histidine phosphatase family protein [uncultured Tessaracoccus sp.]|uniref:histidine phosphatase family protein n=1 Tax=uncultured Tessaracoccus sp. TaxID=905023 RepID=UPI0025E9046C|nr:histidine phosphatase family protein [uncultured Tessaracoccus sp.]